jgi:hypothetical protein
VEGKSRSGSSIQVNTTKVSIDNVVRVTTTMSLSSLSSSSGKYYLGLTGATGSSWMSQMVYGWTFDSYSRKHHQLDALHYLMCLLACTTSGNCSTQATCTPLSKTTFSCACNAGYYGNGYTCCKYHGLI